MGVVLATEAPPGLPQEPLERVFGLSRGQLAQTKARVLAGDAGLQAAVDRLRGDAVQALRATPVSVMDKRSTPPSGDKHDYMSRGPYWWPDPTKPEGLPYLRRDGLRNPDAMSDFDRRSIDQMAANVETLAFAYYLIGEEAYGKRAAQLLRTWFLDPATRMNPHLNFGQGIPGVCQGRGIGIIETHVLVDVVDAVGLLQASPVWTAQDQEGLVAWCGAYLKWLRNSDLGRQEAKARNNHGTWYDAQVVSLALMTGQEQLARQVLEASRDRRLPVQFEPDGRQPLELARTRSFHYSLFNLSAWFFLASAGEQLDIDLWHYRAPDGRSLKNALDYLAAYADPQKTWPHKELYFFRPSLLPPLFRAVAVYGETPYGNLIGQFLAQEADGHRARLGSAHPRLFPDATCDGTGKGARKVALPYFRRREKTVRCRPVSSSIATEPPGAK